MVCPDEINDLVTADMVDLRTHLLQFRPYEGLPVSSFRARLKARNDSVIAFRNDERVFVSGENGDRLYGSMLRSINSMEIEPLDGELSEIDWVDLLPNM